LKWKPPSENSIDFKLELRFPPQRGKPSDPDFFAKPTFMLKEWKGGSGNNANYEFFDVMEIGDAQWDKYVLSHISFCIW
jgi:mRNA guanylyltransferase